MSGNNGGPWGGGGGNRGGGNRGSGGGNRGDQPQIPEIDEIVKKGQEQLRVLMGGGGRGGANGGGTGGPGFSKRGVLIGMVALAVMWLVASLYRVEENERSVELLFGEYYRIGQPGLRLAPWPIISHEIVPTTSERTTEVGTGRTAIDTGLMLTRDEAVVDIEFQLVWNVADPARFLFNLADPRETVRAASESAMRDIIARTELSPILNRDRGAIAADLEQAVQEVLDSYESGINVIRVNFDKADPPEQVISAFRDVQTARQERDRLEREADAYANRVLAQARGQAAQLQEEAEAYRAEVVNNAEGEAARFVSVYSEYINAPEVTRKRMYLETMEIVLGDMNLTILDNVTATGDGSSGSGVLPFLPLDQLTRQRGPN